MHRLAAFTLLGLALPALHAQPKAPDKAALAAKARALLKQYCVRCHGVDFQSPGRNVLDLKSLEGDEADGKIWLTPGKPKESRLWVRFGTSMPPKAIRERPSPEDRKVIEEWIAAGAPPFPEVKARRFVPTLEVIAAMREHLNDTDEKDRPYLRFFTLTHLHNDARIPDVDLRYFKAALSKVINSLSWRPRVVVSKAVDKQKTVFVLDIRDLDWDRADLWKAVLKAYPYGLDYSGSDDDKLRRADAELTRLAGGLLPHVRGDWFVATASRPPLYEKLLQLPTDAKVLEKKLGVDVEENFRRGQLQRAGFASSGVSGQNRMVERHDASYGAYWKSYDFKEGGKRGLLARFPLGPRFKGNPYDAQAFQHDGGEIVFHLPNQLQGYFLIDNKDRFIPKGPEEVVSDSLKTSGTSAIVNGLSCMACHKHGVVIFEKDEIRTGTGVFGEARQKVLQLYPEYNPVWKKTLAEDEARFLGALDKAIGPFVRVGEDKGRPIKEFPEPVGELARRYRLVDLKLADVALELGIEKPELLAGMIKGNRKLQELGLGPLLRDGAVKRGEWERVGARSMFQRAAQELGVGRPHSFVAD
jgi:serine/threonine-protein kinase